MVLLPTNLRGLTVYPSYGKIVLDENMTKKEVEEAQKIYPSIKWIEKTIETKKKRK